MSSFSFYLRLPHNSLQILISLLIFSICSSVKFEKQALIIDTDAGADDAMAIMMILSDSRRFKVEAITCVQGNTGVHNVSKNVLETLDVMKRLDIPVYVGSNTGLVYSAKSDNYFGMDGFGDFIYDNPPDIHLLKEQHAAVELAERVKQKPGTISVICIGPLTNIALASLINPKFFEQVKMIMILGGSYKGEGNIGPGIEFNMYADPEAAESFFTRLPASTPTILLPYETVKEDGSFSISWRRNVLGRLESDKMKFLNLAERKSLAKVSQWLCFDPSLSSLLINPNIVDSYMIGQPVVDTNTKRGFMNILTDRGSVKVITGLDNQRLEKTLYFYLK
uniref:Venom nucleosidase 1 n=1 Tax=Oncocephalus sp. TaxID=2944721 RepID=A0AB38ZER0_9HEMI